MLVLGAVTLLGAVAFGSATLGLIGIGLAAAGALARGWAAFAGAPASAVFAADPAPAVEGDEVRLTVETHRRSRAPGTNTVRAEVGRLGNVECRLEGHGRRARGELVLGRLPRGRFLVSGAVLEVSDPLGIESVALPLDSPVAVVVHPRLVELRSLFSDAGRLGADGRRLLLRRPAGFDFHSVREYEQGESLRRVHWPTTARRGQLMVKELEDSPSDAVAVVLDCDPAGAAGTSPDSSFDAAVRAAGSLLRAHAGRRRRALLVTTRRGEPAVAVGAVAGEFDSALAALAAAEADAPDGLERVLDGARSPVAQVGELVVVSASLGRRSVECLLRFASRRLVSVVWVDARSWSQRAERTDAGLLRLNAAGIPVSVVRRGDDLVQVLEAPAQKARAHG
jgi:uncharacterized protein (DUF58 family)